MKLLSASEILAANDRPRELVEVPEWGGSVWVQTMSGAARDGYEAAVLRLREANADPMSNLRARVCAACMVDEQGDPLLSADQVEALGRKSGAALDRVFAVALRLSAISATDIEELTGNSSSDPSAAPGTGSPSSSPARSERRKRG